ncbi:DUF2846 domain-containing protein, partial [Escherichia coli]|uniref:DUF2846 domain-containing protein n=1 Tax=Escherichia coli TaxID=562 RepID=UPI001BD2ABEB
LYRPRSQWADEELEAPGIFLNNELIGSLPSNGYLAFEFETGSYKLEMRRLRRQRLPETRAALVLGRRRAGPGQDRHLNPARV